jgi:hypothetical protein
MRWDRRAISILAMLGLGLGIQAWLRENPGHNPWAPLDLRDPPGWTTRGKIADLRGDPAQCRAVLSRSEVAFIILEPVGDGACRRSDRTVLEQSPLSPARPSTTCAVAAAFELWLEMGVSPAAQKIFGQPVESIEHFGAYSCRRLYGRNEGPWSEHATGNAIDIAAFVLADGTRISVLDDWSDEAEEARFLRQARDAACRSFGTVLSPDYNAAHADHLHLDQAQRGIGGVCR